MRSHSLSFPFSSNLRGLFLAVGLLGVLPFAFAADPKPEPGIQMELNKLEQRGQVCVLYFVFQNPFSVPLEALKLELIVFDRGGLIQQRLSLDAAPLRAHKTMVKLFPFPNTRCDSIGRILINDIPTCRGPKGPIPGCLDHLSVSARGRVSLAK